MPELPEVETIRNKLRKGIGDFPSILGMEIHGAMLLWNRTLDRPEPEIFFAKLTGQLIEEIERRGKYFIFHLSQDYLLIHLRMSGDLIVAKQSEPVEKTCRLAIFLQDDWRLSFVDTRKFGRAWLVPDPDDVVGGLGPEPLDQEFDAESFYERLTNRSRQLKPLLLDQQFIAGMGNIYTDEALHMAKLNPLMLSSQVSATQAHNLLSCIRYVLEEGIRHNGSSIDWVYRGGDHQNYFRVYGRKGEACRECGTFIEKIVVGQRGTYFCPKCQPPGSETTANSNA